MPVSQQESIEADGSTLTPKTINYPGKNQTPAIKALVNNGMYIIQNRLRLQYLSY
jgi:hypothetical protein